MTEKELMLSEHLYIADDEELARDHQNARRLTRLINTLTEEDAKEQRALYRQLFGHVGERFWVEPPFRTDYGCHTYIGEDFYANYDCIFIDVAEIHIGNNVMFGPRVCIFTAGHPIDPVIRNSKLEYGKEVHIGDNVWIGGNTVINPGVTSGNNVVKRTSRNRLASSSILCPSFKYLRFTSPTGLIPPSDDIFSDSAVLT